MSHGTSVVDPDSGFYLNADPDSDSGSQTNADPDAAQTLPSLKVEFLHDYTYCGYGIGHTKHLRTVPTVGIWYKAFLKG
jgi:hypothetical protein